MKYLSHLLIIATILCSCQNKSNPANHAAKDNEPMVELAYRAPSQLGEGAFWNHQSQTFWWIDILGKTFNIYDPITQKNRAYPTPSLIGTVVPTDDGSALVALEDGLYLIDPETGHVEPHVSIEANVDINRFNDGKCDPSGRLWVGSLNLKQDLASGHLYSIDHKGTVVKHLSDITISNGIVWTKDTKTMYYIDTPTKVIRAYDFDNASGTISHERVAVTVPESLGYPDGMAIDVEDKLWVGLWNGNCVARFDPLDGTLMTTIPVPAHNVTACAFGGRNLDTLYITTAAADMTDEEKAKYPDAGSVFSVVPGVKGVKSTFYQSR